MNSLMEYIKPHIIARLTDNISGVGMIFVKRAYLRILTGSTWNSITSILKEKFI